MPKHEFREVKLYVDEQGRQVKEFLTVPKDKAKTFYRGIGNMLAQRPGVPPQKMTFEFGFPEGTTLEQAFETFESEANLAVDRFRKEQAQRIVPAAGNMTILGPDGKRVG